MCGDALAEIARLAPAPEHCAAGYRAELTDLIAVLERLNTRCRQQSLSWVADMGQEMPYRYQEHIMSELLDALRTFGARVDERRGDAVPSPTGFAERPSRRNIDAPTAVDASPS